MIYFTKRMEMKISLKVKMMNMERMMQMKIFTRNTSKKLKLAPRKLVVN